MIKGIKVDLTIKDNTTGAYLVVPVLPSTIAYKDGSKRSDAATILNLGEVEIPTGVNLDSFGWSSFFPARYDASYCATSSLLKPLDYRARFIKWKNEGTPLQLVCPAAGVNETMYLEDYDGELTGFEGDIRYNVEFRQLKTIRPRKLTPDGKVPPKGKQQAADRAPAATSGGIPKTHTVKKGDTLSGIAKKYKIASWRTIYDKNRNIIKDPDKLQIGWVLKL